MDVIKLLSAEYAKNNGALVYSGTLALEVALHLAGVKPGNIVAISSVGSYKIALSVIRVGAIPFFINPSENLLVNIENLSNLIKKFDISTIIAVHYLGLPLNIKKIKESINSQVVLIEDVSQGWNIKYNGFYAGFHSDIVVTSFGASKPLSFGFGGAIFSNTDKLSKILDDNVHHLKMIEDIPIPYKLNPNSLNNIAAKIEEAHQNLKNRKIVAQKIKHLFFEHSFKRLNFSLWPESLNDSPSWHRIPFFFDSKRSMDNFCNIANKVSLQYQVSLPLTPELAFVKKQKHFHVEGNVQYFYILLHPTNDNIPKIIKIFEHDQRQ